MRIHRMRAALGGIIIGLLALPGEFSAQAAPDLRATRRAGLGDRGRFVDQQSLFDPGPDNSDRMSPESRGAWMQRLGSGNSSKYSQQGTPLVKDGVIYLPTGQQDIFALDAKTGEILWQFVSEDVDPRSDGTWASRGVALGEGLVFNGRIDGSLVAVDQKTGAWPGRRRLATSHPMSNRLHLAGGRKPNLSIARPSTTTGWSTPVLSGGDRGLRGRLTALDAKHRSRIVAVLQRARAR